MSFSNSTFDKRGGNRSHSGVEKHKSFVEVSAATAMSDQSVFDVYRDKVTAHPAVTHGSYAYLKEMLRFS